MAPDDRLPPPPKVPVRSPPAAVRGEIEARVSASPSLEVRAHLLPRPARAVLLCHPHPLYGGSMHSPVPLAIAKCMAEVAPTRLSWARFNFRGVGTSEGTYDEGRGEVDDGCAVLSYLADQAPGAPITVCGHSFGATVALRVAARDRRVDRVLMIAPSASLFGSAAAPRLSSVASTIFIGDRDELVELAGVRDLASEIGAELRVFEGFDHHFLKSRRALAEAALPVIAPEVSFP